MKIDLMSISGHKLYGPKGVGALFVRRRPRVRVEPIQSGGGQERGLRSGTVPTPLVVGLGAACKLAGEEMAYDHSHVERLSRRLVTELTSALPHVIFNGDPEHTYPGCVNLSFAYVEGESLLMALKDVALSSGSACTSASLEPSYVLRAIGADEDLAHSSIRLDTQCFCLMRRLTNSADFHLGLASVASRRRRRWSTRSNAPSKRFSACAPCRRSGRCSKKALTSRAFSGHSTKEILLVCFFL